MEEELKTDVESHKFLSCLMTPAKTCCCGSCNLKSACIVIIITDFIVGIWDTIAFLNIQAAYRDPSIGYPTNLFLIFVANWLLDVTLIIGAICGSLGISSLNPKHMKNYSICKHVYMFGILVLNFWYTSAICGTDELDDLDIGCAELLILTSGLYLLWQIPVTYYIWSVAKRLQANQGDLVVNGVGVVSGEVVDPRTVNIPDNVEMGQVSETPRQP